MVQHTNPLDVIDTKITKAPRFYSPSGYGRKIPTEYMVRLKDKRWRRVYVCCYSNSGTAYIETKDCDFLVIDTDTEYKLRDLSDA
jgi:hypothetical protein